MANTSTNLVTLDFSTYKTNLKEYLRNNTLFQDIDFEASNINVLLDILAYNTYHNGFYLNMIGNEMFMDSALLRDSIVSHAKELNYTPRSTISSTATLKIVVTPNVYEDSLTIPRGTSFTSTIGSNTYVFTTDQNIVMDRQLNPSNTLLNRFFSNTVAVHEGFIVADTFVVDETNTAQRFVLSNPNVDTSSIRVSVLEDGNTQLQTYILSSSFFNVTSTDKVFFVQGAENSQYEIVFGNDVTGRKPKNGAIISCEYRVASGDPANGADTFRLDGAILGTNGSYIGNEVAITVVEAAQSGAAAESIESVRFNAPRYFQTQERAITTSDYETLLRTTFPEIDSVHAYGGEEHSPPQYGKVMIAIDIFNADGIPTSVATKYRKFLKEKMPLTIDPVFIDPIFTYCDITSNVTYNLNASAVGEGDIKNGVKTTIQSFCNTNINDFDVTLRYSRLTTAIDNTYDGIISNETTLKLIKYLVPTPEQTVSRENIQTVIYYSNPITSIITDSFTLYYQNTLFRNVYLQDDGNGLLNAFVGGKSFPVGSVNYEQGQVSIDNLRVASYSGEGIAFTATPLNNDVAVRLNEILQTRESDIHVFVTGVYAQ